MEPTLIRLSAFPYKLRPTPPPFLKLSHREPPYQFNFHPFRPPAPKFAKNFTPSPQQQHKPASLPHYQPCPPVSPLAPHTRARLTAPSPLLSFPAGNASARLDPPTSTMVGRRHFSAPAV